MSTPHNPDNRLNIDYTKPPQRKVNVPGGIIDAHNHAGAPQYSQPMVEAARAYGITQFVTMAPLEHVPALKEKFPNTFHFVAVPGWKRDMPKPGPEFFTDWKRRLEIFKHEHHAKLLKFHSAPGTMKAWSTSLDDPRIQDIAKFAYDLGYHFMSHVGDPRAWFTAPGKYADQEKFPYGNHDAQFAMLERMLEKYPDRLHLGAHFGGCLENLDALAKRLEKFPHYILDTSATRWIVRAVAEQSAQAVRDFILHFQDRILFGSDNVALGFEANRDFHHFASRYYAHQLLWETDYHGESPIDDPDAGKGFNPATNAFNPAQATGIPELHGVNLPPDVLTKIYRTNTERYLLS